MPALEHIPSIENQTISKQFARNSLPSHIFIYIINLNYTFTIVACFLFTGAVCALHCAHHTGALQQSVPVLQVYLGASAAECIHILLPLHELLYAELPEVQGSAAAAAGGGSVKLES